MTIKLKSRKETVIDYLKNNTHAYQKNPSVYKNGMDLFDEFIGEVNGDKFWIQKIRPRLFRGPFRAFFGMIVETHEGTQIIGKFRFISIYKKQALVVHILLSIVLAFGFCDFQNHLTCSIILLLLLNLFYEMLFHLNIIFCILEEREVRKLLNNIDNNTKPENKKILIRLG